MSDDQKPDRVAKYNQFPDKGLFNQIVSQRNFPDKRVLRASDREWQGNKQILVDTSNGFENSSISCFLRRIPPAGESDIHRHNFEAIGYALKGSGYEIHDGERIDWSEGDVIYIPANVWHQHVNPNEDEEAIILLITNWPLMTHLGACTMEPATSWEEALSRPNAYPDPYLYGAKSR